MSKKRLFYAFASLTLFAAVGCKKDNVSPNYATSEYAEKWIVSGSKTSTSKQGVNGSLKSDTYDFFEFTESRYLIKKANGAYLYGKLTPNSDITELVLDNFGTIEIVIEGDNLSMNCLGEKLTLYKAEYNVPIAQDAVKKMTYDVWVLKETDSGVDIGSEFFMTKNGTYLLYRKGTITSLNPKVKKKSLA